jgi:hypothetical protein
MIIANKTDKETPITKLLALWFSIYKQHIYEEISIGS